MIWETEARKRRTLPEVPGPLSGEDRIWIQVICTPDHSCCARAILMSQRHFVSLVMALLEPYFCNLSDGGVRVRLHDVLEFVKQRAFALSAWEGITKSYLWNIVGTV